jgi:hypothetical protein
MPMATAKGPFTECGAPGGAFAFSRQEVPGHVRIRVQPHVARHDIAGQIAQPPVMSIRVGLQPDKGFRDSDSQLLGHHSGGLIDLRSGAFLRILDFYVGVGRPRRATV